MKYYLCSYISDEKIYFWRKNKIWFSSADKQDYYSTSLLARIDRKLASQKVRYGGIGWQSEIDIEADAR